MTKRRVKDSMKNMETVELLKADSDIEIDFINEVKNELCQRMDTMIEEKIGEITTRRKGCDIKKFRNWCNSFTTQTTNFADTGRMRDENVIIHGIYEGNRDDGVYLTKFFDILQMGHTRGEGLIKNVRTTLIFLPFFYNNL